MAAPKKIPPEIHERLMRSNPHYRKQHEHREAARRRGETPAKRSKP